MSILNQHFTLANEILIPKLGFGTWQISNNQAPEAVIAALELGYTHIDTARVYGNEDGVGRGISQSSLAREDIFLTTKVPAEVKSYEGAKASIAKSLATLNLDYVDLLLIHAPKPWSEMDSGGTYPYFEENLEVYRAMEEAYENGQAKSLGISNFDVADIINITSGVDIQPVVNQIEFHIGQTQDEITEYCQANDILIEAYSPIGTGELLDNQEIKEVAQRYNKSVAQLCIRYCLEKNTLPLPKSSHKNFIKENTEVDFEISHADIKILDAIRLT